MIDSTKVEQANNRQAGGNHYGNTGIQCWDYIVANGLGFLEGNIVKYVTRHKRKGGVEDLLKARHYIDKLIEVEIRAQASAPDPL